MNNFFKLFTWPYRTSVYLIWRLKYYVSIRSSCESIVTLQEAKFLSLGLNRSDGFKRLSEKCLKVFQREYDENDGMFSEHLVLLAAISCSPNFNVKNILEIGTYDGRTASLLAEIFPNAQILTIDLPSSDRDFVETYRRSEGSEDFVLQRDGILSEYANIRFKELNSINLVNYSPSYFELIWIDGAHGYPVVSIDLINSYRLATDGGVVLIDDVFLRAPLDDRFYSSIGAYETLKTFVSGGLINSFELLYKRLGFNKNLKEGQKFIGFFIK